MSGIDLAALVKNGLNVADLEAAPEVVDGGAEAAPRNPWPSVVLPSLKVRSYLTTAPDPRKWTIRTCGPGESWHGVMPTGIIGLFAAAGGAGKTYSLIELALLVAAGGTDVHNCAWLDTFHVTGGPVLFLAAEESADELHRRLFRVARRWDRHRYTYSEGDGYLTASHLARAAEQLVIIPGAGRPDLALMEAAPERGEIVTSNAGRSLLDWMQAPPGGVPWSLVIVDPLARVAGGEVESSNLAATRAIQILEKMAAAPGSPSVLVAHHTSQASRQTRASDATAIRGVTGLSDAARFAATLAPLPRFEDAPEIVQFTVAKHNYSPPIPPVLLTRDDGALRAANRAELDCYEDARDEAEREAAEERGRRQGEAAAARSVARKKASAALIGGDDD